MKILERVEALLYGNVYHRDGDFESIAAEVLGMTQQQVDEELKLEERQERERQETLLNGPP